MKEACYAWGVTVIGVLLLLPFIGVNQLGDLTTGITSWLVPLIILSIGIKGLFKVYKK